MSKHERLSSDEVAHTDAQLGFVRHVVVRALVARGASLSDSEDVAQEVILRLISSPEGRERIVDAEHHTGYFVQQGSWMWLSRLRSEQRRRARESYYSPPPSSTENGLGDLPSQARLTDTQRRYLEALFVREMSVSEVAAAEGVTDRAVRAVLARAREALKTALTEQAQTLD